MNLLTGKMVKNKSLDLCSLPKSDLGRSEHLSNEEAVHTIVNIFNMEGRSQVSYYCGRGELKAEVKCKRKKLLSVKGSSGGPK